MSKPDFNNFKTIALDPSANSEPDPSWNILRNGTAVLQSLNSSPGLAVGRGNLEGIDFEGSLFVDTMSDVGYIGFVFSYQDNSKFYVVMWKKSRQVYWKNSPFTATANSRNSAQAGELYSWTWRLVEEQFVALRRYQGPCETALAGSQTAELAI